MSKPSDVTRVLGRCAAGHSGAADELWTMVYGELRRLAEQFFQGERTGHTLQPTALVHEAFFRLVGAEARDCQDRVQFFKFAGRAMRRILIDHARRRRAVKRGGDRERVPLDTALAWAPGCEDDLVALGEALEKLEAQDPDLVRLVECHAFGGMTFTEVAQTLGVAPITAKRMWKMAKGWLHREIRKGA